MSIGVGHDLGRRQDLGERDAQILRPLHDLAARSIHQDRRHQSVNLVRVSHQRPQKVGLGQTRLIEQDRHGFRIAIVAVRVDPAIEAGPNRRWVQVSRSEPDEPGAVAYRLAIGEPGVLVATTEQERQRLEDGRVDELPAAIGVDRGDDAEGGMEPPPAYVPARPMP